MSALWAGEWHSVNRLDGDKRHILYDDLTPKLFRTRRECRAWLDEKFGYIRERPDLQAEPFGWRMPQAVMVNVVVASPDRRAA